MAAERLSLRRAFLAPTDPAGLPRAPKAAPIFDNRSVRNTGAPMIAGELKAVPDDRLIATQVALGMPRQAAEQVRYSPMARFLALKLWCDVQDAAEGDREAKTRIDYHRQAFVDLRRAELIADDPRRTTPAA